MDDAEMLVMCEWEGKDEKVDAGEDASGCVRGKKKEIKSGFCKDAGGCVRRLWEGE